MKLNKNSNSSKQLDGPDTAQPKLFKTLLTTNVDRPYNFHARPKGYTVAMGVNIYFQLSIRQKTPIQKHQHLLCLSFLTPFSINPIILLKSRGKYKFYQCVRDRKLPVNGGQQETCELFSSSPIGRKTVTFTEKNRPSSSSLMGVVSREEHEIFCPPPGPQLMTTLQCCVGNTQILMCIVNDLSSFQDVFPQILRLEQLAVLTATNESLSSPVLQLGSPTKG